METLLQLPLVLYPSRRKMVMLLSICLVFVAIGVLMVRDGDRTGYFCCGFFALGIPVFLISMSHRAAYLRLHEEGFTFSSLYRVHTIAWADVLDFGVMAIRGKRIVGCNFAPGYGKSQRMRAVNQALAGFDAALPDNYGMKAEALAELMGLLADVHGTPPVQADGAFQPAFDKAQTLDRW